MLGEGDPAGGGRRDGAGVLAVRGDRGCPRTGGGDGAASGVADAQDHGAAAAVSGGLLEYLAAQRQTTVGELLSQQLDDLASEHLDALSAAIPDFAEAFVWPHALEEAAEAPRPRALAGVGMRIGCS